MAPRRDLLAVVGKVVLGQPPFEEGARIDARRAVRLVEDQVAAALPFVAAEEVVEADLEQVGRAGVAGDVPAEFAVRLVGAHHHRQRVPAHQRGQALLDRQVAREGRLARGRDGVDVGRAQRRLPAHFRRARRGREHVHDLAHALRAGRLQQRGQRIAPFGGLGGVAVGERRGLREPGLDGRVAHRGLLERRTVGTSLRHG